MTAIEDNTRTGLLHGIDAGFDQADRHALDAVLAGGRDARAQRSH